MIHQSPPDSPDAPDELEILLFETSPYGYLDAIVQHDHRVVYFYLNQKSPPGSSVPITRACWVRNLEPGPYVLNEDEMKAGRSPLLPRTHCRYGAQTRPVPHPDNLRVVWFEEGNGAALMETRGGTETMLAVIPPWSGIDQFHGYADECASESILCWPLPDNPNLARRIDRADQFWKSFATPPDPFIALQNQILDAYTRAFCSENASGSTQQYYAIQGEHFPPRGLIHLKGELSSGVCHLLATVGMSLCPQPNVELMTENPRAYRRVELAIALHQEFSESQIGKVITALSQLAAYPWQTMNWFGPGHTCHFRDALPGVETVTLVHDRDAPPPSPIKLPDFRDDPINLLWLRP